MNKYNAKKTELDGITFDSKLEANRYAELKLMERAGLISNLERQKWFELIPKDGKHRARGYVADFVYKDENGAQVVEDVKGVRTDLYRWKKDMMRWIHRIEIKEV